MIERILESNRVHTETLRAYISDAFGPFDAEHIQELTPYQIVKKIREMHPDDKSIKSFGHAKLFLALDIMLNDGLIAGRELSEADKLRGEFSGNPVVYRILPQDTK